MPRFWPFRRSSKAEPSASAGARRRLFGREYIAGTPYALPSDLSEMNRLDFQHYMLRQAFKGIYAAPISVPSDILDVGTGTGRWAKEMATLFPQARVTALDIKDPNESAPGEEAPEQRSNAYTFVRGNILEGLPFPDASFDFVHQRLLFFAIPGNHWQFVVNELARVTRPGGWVEVVEGHYGYEPMGPAAQRISDAMLPAMLQRGIDPRQSDNLAQFLQAAGLRDVRTRTVNVPVGDWGGHIGHLALTDVMTFSQAARPLLLAQGMSESDFAQLVATMRDECERLRYTWPFYIAYGQRA
ncbi:MAG TPA: class I SAM-dependent methyltransferase [Ktedonobacterales bacterium]|nr:class I SAM-dependent methyltransferase [Ktedonobacterales bacterium]